jgi:putative restriction endonuclease
LPKYEPRNWFPVAGLAWPILARVASRRDTISYKDLAIEIGEHHRAIARVLGVIQDYCLDAKLPPLTAVVVSKQRGVPGAGFIAWDVDDLDAGLGFVYSNDWTSRPNPFLGFGSADSVDSLATRLVEDPSSSGDILRQVRDRGIAQRIFREALLKAYDYRCAMCDLSFYRALEAHHIVPFSECSIDQRIAVTNGLLLCPNHHKLLELGCFSVEPDLTISYYDPELSEGPYSEADKQASAALHGKKLRIPLDPELRPKFPIEKEGRSEARVE